MAATAIRAPLLRLRAGRLDDGRLAELAAAGDERAFEAIYDRHHRPLLGFCRHMLGSQEEGEDALQQTFLRAHRSLVAQGAPDELRPWLFAIARNRCLTMLAARRTAAVPVEELESATEGLSAGVEQRAELRELLGDIARLPDEQRSALVLAELGDLSHAEIAAVIEVPTAKVKALVHQARTRLIADRDARETPCEDVREQLSTARAGELRRGPLRRHLALCEPCRAHKEAVAEQRSALALVLPVLPSAGLKDAIFGALGGGGGGAAAAASGGAVLSGGGTTAGLAAKGLGAKLAIGAALAGGAGGGAVVVERMATTPERAPTTASGVARTPAAPTPAGARREAADAVLVDDAGRRTGDGEKAARGRPETAGGRRSERAEERRQVQARAKVERDHAADKEAKLLDREQRSEDRAAAKQQRTAAREQRLAARPVRAKPAPKRPTTPTPPAPAKRPVVAPGRTVQAKPVTPPTVLAAPSPVPSPSLAPSRGQSDAAQGRDVGQEAVLP
jgi:RNA polymerase sigma factor (sigma-70 family)